MRSRGSGGTPSLRMQCATKKSSPVLANVCNGFTPNRHCEEQREAAIQQTAMPKNKKIDSPKNRRYTIHHSPLTIHHHDLTRTH